MLENLIKKNSSELAPGLQPEEEFEKPLVSQIQDSSKNPEGAEFHGFQSVGEWGFARRASSEARSEELSSATDFSPWVSTIPRSSAAGSFIF